VLIAAALAGVGFGVRAFCASPLGASALASIRFPRLPWRLQLSSDGGAASETGGDVDLPDGARVVGFGLVDVDGGPTPLSPPVPGVVESVAVKEGETVAAGAILVKLRTGIADKRIEQAKQAVEQARTKLSQARRAPRLYVERIKEQGQAVAAAEAIAETHRQELDTIERLSDDAAISDAKIRAERQRYKVALAKLEAERLRLEQLKIEDPNETVQLAEAEVAKALALLGEAEENLDLHALRAPEAGKILRVFVAKGQAMGGALQIPAVQFRPDRPVVIRCEIGQEFVDRLAVGQRAEVLADRLDGKRWYGKVARIADWIAPRRSLLDEPLERNDVRTLECMVELDPGQAPLRHGQRMRVVISDK
jgi:multidrug resistance efflux pump